MRVVVAARLWMSGPPADKLVAVARWPGKTFQEMLEERVRSKLQKVLAEVRARREGEGKQK
jgi:hypothetical protein